MPRRTTVCAFLSIVLTATVSAGLRASASEETCFGQPATIADHRRRITGTPGDDVIVGDGDDNRIDGGGGFDLICGGGGNDHIEQEAAGALTASGGPGRDYLGGGVNDDRLYGEGGNDKLEGWLGNDLHDGGDGNDWLYGHGGGDVLRGGAGNDYVIADGDNLDPPSEFDDIDCGLGARDVAAPDSADTPVGCERIR